MVPDIVDSVIVVWVSGLIDLSFSFNADKSRPFEAAVGADRGDCSVFASDGINRLLVMWDMRLWPVSF